jgi:hypothetical protein
MSVSVLIVVSDSDVTAKETAKAVREKGFSPCVVSVGVWHMFLNDAPTSMNRALVTVESDLKARSFNIVTSLDDLKEAADIAVDEVLPPAPIPAGAGIGTVENFLPGGRKSKGSKSSTNVE